MASQSDEIIDLKRLNSQQLLVKILLELESLKEQNALYSVQLQQLQEKIADMKVQIAVLQTKAIGFAALASTLVSILVAVLLQ